jgi:hypothetical protein
MGFIREAGQGSEAALQEGPGRSASNRAVYRLGVAAGAGTGVLGALYLAVLVAGLRSLASPLDPIGDPWFSLMEILILLLMPFMVGLMVAVHAWAPPARRVWGVLAIVFMALVAGITSCVHFAILTLSRHPTFVTEDWSRILFSFEWPSVAYALDILAWDLFFPASALCAAAVFRGRGLSRAVSVLLVVSGVLALVGLGGVVEGNMQIRNVGILGYAVVFPLSAVTMAFLFHREAEGGGSADPGEAEGGSPAAPGKGR